MFGKTKDVDRVAHSRARDRARWLIRDHGDEAERIVADKLTRAGLSAGERHIYKLTQRELRVLRREQAAAAKSRELALATPPLRLLGALIDLIGGKGKKRRRRRR